MSSSGDKFWEVTQVKEKLHIRSGKTDTKGLIQIKTFLNEMEAEVVKNNLIAEQINLGYNYL
jgi:predicted DNA-binding WGR domain protein